MVGGLQNLRRQPPSSSVHEGHYRREECVCKASCFPEARAYVKAEAPNPKAVVELKKRKYAVVNVSLVYY